MCATSAQGGSQGGGCRRRGVARLPCALRGGGGGGRAAARATGQEGVYLDQSILLGGAFSNQPILVLRVGEGP